MEEEVVGEDAGEGAAGGGGGLPTPYAELSCHFRPLESIAEECGVAGAAYHLQKAKMAMIAAYASKPVRQTYIGRQDRLRPTLGLGVVHHILIFVLLALAFCSVRFCCYASNTSQKLTTCSLVRFFSFFYFFPSSIFCGFYTTTTTITTINTMISLIVTSEEVDVCVCLFSSPSFWTSSSLDVLAGVTQKEGHTGFLIHLLSAVRSLIFLARRIQPFLSLVDREVEFCVLTI